MNLLLDTCTFLWYITRSPGLPERVRAAIADRENAVHLSSVSVFEIASKQAAGRLVLPSLADPFIPDIRTQLEILSLPFSEAAALQVARLPKIHKDPFDRMLIGQAIAEGMILVTPDPHIHRYPIRWTW
ncbi:MAG: type II toxin-antitoxin system VapC family toxin [Fimbriimonas sp.]